MLVDDLLKEVEQDSVIDKDNPISTTVAIPHLVSKYYRYLQIESSLLRSLELELDKLNKELFNYYSGHASDEVYKEKGFFDRKLLKEDLKMYVAADPAMIKIQGRIYNQSFKVKIIEDFIKQLNNRNFLVRNIIEWTKFINGG